MTPTSPALVPVPASAGKRAMALLVDLLGAALVAFVASTLSHGSVAVTVTTVVEFVAVEAIMIAITGRSIGVSVTRCALVRADSSQLCPSLGRSFGYVSLTALTSIIVPVPFVSVLVGGYQGSWMAKLCSLQCVTFAPEDTMAEAAAPSSPYGNARARTVGGYTNFGSVTGAPSAQAGLTREHTWADQPRASAPLESAAHAPVSPFSMPAPANPQAPGRPIAISAPAPNRFAAPQESARRAEPAAPTSPAPRTPMTPGAPTAPSTPPVPLPAPAQSAPYDARGAGDMTAPAPSKASLTPAAPTATAPLAALLLDTGQSIPINRTIVLGRAPSQLSAADTPIAIDDQTRSLSRTHVRIMPSATGITIEDLNSANGTRARTPGGRTHTLVPGRPIELPINSQLLLGERLISVVDLRQRR